MKKIMSIALMLTLLLSLAPTIFADETETVGGKVTLTQFLGSAFDNTKGIAQSYRDKMITTNANDFHLVSDWAKSEINEILELGLIPEDLQDNFTKNITRSEFAKVAVNFIAFQYNMDFDDAMRTYCKTRSVEFSGNAFTDTDDIYVGWANTLGIVKGKGNRIFDPDGAITREEAAHILMNTFFVYGGGIKHGQKYLLFEQLSDYQDISDWAISHAAYVWEMNIMKGTNESSFEPHGYYTREQCYVTFLRLYKNAPSSRYNGAAMCPISYEDLVSEIEGLENYQSLYELETNICNIIYGVQTGTPHGGHYHFWIVYKDGGRKNITNRLYSAGPMHSRINLENFRMNDNMTELYCSQVEREGGIDYKIILENAKVEVID